MTGITDRGTSVHPLRPGDENVGDICVRYKRQPDNAERWIRRRHVCADACSASRHCAAAVSHTTTTAVNVRNHHK